MSMLTRTPTKDGKAQDKNDAPKPGVLTAISRHLVVTFAVGLAFLAIGALIADRLLQPGAFEFKRLDVRGEFEKIDLDEVERVIAAAVQGNFFSVDLAQIEQAARSVYWVSDAQLQRRWPDTLVMFLTEATPIARWGESQWLTKTRRVIDLPEDVVIDDLPSLAGPNGSHEKVFNQYKHWRAVLKAVGLTVQEIELTPQGTWTMQLVGEVTVALVKEDETEQVDDTNAPAKTTTKQHYLVLRMGKDSIDGRVTRFAQVYARSLKSELHRIASVDLRYPNGFAVTWTQDSSAEQTAQSKLTTSGGDA